MALRGLAETVSDAWRAVKKMLVKAKGKGTLVLLPAEQLKKLEPVII